MTKLQKILKGIAEKMNHDDLDFLMECAVVFYWKMVYGDWHEKGRQG